MLKMTTCAVARKITTVRVLKIYYSYFYLISGGILVLSRFHASQLPADAKHLGKPDYIRPNNSTTT